MPLPFWVPIAAGLAGAGTVGYFTGLRGENSDYYGKNTRKMYGLPGGSRRTRFRRTRRLRKRTKRVVRRRFGRRKKASRGFRRKAAFAGRAGMTMRHLMRAIESKRLINIVAGQTLTNAGVNTTREYVCCPTQFLVQQNPASTDATAFASSFEGNRIFLKGIRCQFFATQGPTFNDHINFKLYVFKTMIPVDYTAFTWTQTTNTGTEITHVVDFFERNYGAASSVTNPQNYFAPINHYGGGPTCIYAKEFSVPASASGASGATNTKVDIYLPLNKIETFDNMVNGANELTTAPNFMNHGDYLFLLKYYNAQDNTSTSSLTLSTTIFTMYFKDP